MYIYGNGQQEDIFYLWETKAPLLKNVWIKVIFPPKVEHICNYLRRSKGKVAQVVLLSGFLGPRGFEWNINHFRIGKFRISNCIWDVNRKWYG